MQLAAPRRHAKEIQPHRRMRISEHAGHPRISGLHLDAQFLAQLAHQRMIRRLAGFDFAAGKFPIAGPDFVWGRWAGKEGVVGALQHGGGDFDDFGFSIELFNETSYLFNPNNPLGLLSSPLQGRVRWR